MRYIYSLIVLFLIFSCEVPNNDENLNIDNEIEILKEEINNLRLIVNEISDNQTEDSEIISSNSESILELISRINELEVSDSKYDSDIVGCYLLGDYGFQILNNGIGILDTGSATAFQLFTWEKTGQNTYTFKFMGYNDNNAILIIVPGSYNITWNDSDDTFTFPVRYSDFSVVDEIIIFKPAAFTGVFNSIRCN